MGPEKGDLAYWKVYPFVLCDSRENLPTPLAVVPDSRD